MRCQEIIEQLIAQSDRPAPAPEVAKHLNSCRACAQVHAEQRALWRSLDAWEAPDVSAGFDNRLYARIEGRGAEAWTSAGWLLRLLRPLQPAFAAALVCVLVLATVVERGRQAPLIPPQATAAMHSQERDDARQIETALDDIQMLSDFDILPAKTAQDGGGKS